MQQKLHAPIEARPLIRPCYLLTALFAAGLSPIASAGSTAPAPSDPPAATEPTAAAHPVELDTVIVKGARVQQESLAEQLRKAMQPKAPRPPADLNRAGSSMKKMADWMNDPDASRHSIGDRRFDTPPPPGDETNGCGADLTEGCEKAQ
ncbi:MAG: hypothetical protein Q7J29_08580 [Stagnimonas sp.]|nr:hypothetical protein [Stagnimonas sp.]